MRQTDNRPEGSLKPDGGSIIPQDDIKSTTWNRFWKALPDSNQNDKTLSRSIDPELEIFPTNLVNRTKLQPLCTLGP